jgi:hypothetical protein
MGFEFENLGKYKVKVETALHYETGANAGSSEEKYKE